MLAHSELFCFRRPRATKRERLTKHSIRASSRAYDHILVRGVYLPRLKRSHSINTFLVAGITTRILLLIFTFNVLNWRRRFGAWYRLDHILSTNLWLAHTIVLSSILSTTSNIVRGVRYRFHLLRGLRRIRQTSGSYSTCDRVAFASLIFLMMV